MDLSQPIVLKSSISDKGGGNPFQRRFLARVPAGLATSFTDEQLEAVQMVFGMRYAARHGVDCRRSLSLPWGHYYLVLLAGRDWRRGERRSRLTAAGRLAFDTIGCALASASMVVAAWRLTRIVVALAA